MDRAVGVEDLRRSANRGQARQGVRSGTVRMHHHETHHEAHEDGSGHEGCSAHHGHHHGCHHGHHHGHHHGSVATMGARLLWVSILNFAFTLLEVVGGLISNSLSLLSDAVHNLADSSAILLAYIAHRASKRKANEQKTYGYKRVEILAAFVNAAILIGICVFLFIEAYERFVNPEPIKGLIMLIVAIAGLLANVVSILLMRADRQRNLNVRAAYLHMLGDALSSVAVIVGGLCIWLWEIWWLDPLITVLVGLYIIWHTWGVLRESADILMQGTPPDLDMQSVHDMLEATPGVAGVHHLHVWRLNDSQIHLEGHVDLTEDLRVSEAEELRTMLAERLKERFGIAHITLQMEHHGGECHFCRGTGCLP